MENITIPFKEYKELLEIKGKYEESKAHRDIEYIQIPVPTYINPISTTYPEKWEVTF
jgi:hypothetical protein